MAKMGRQDRYLRAHLVYFPFYFTFDLILQMGLFSAATAAIITVTVQDLKQNPQDTSTFYLENIYRLQVAADSNASRPLTPAQPPPFSAPNYTICMYIFLFMSLLLDIFTGLLAVVIRGYVPRYLINPRRYFPSGPA
jgi:hypothetical protein